LRFDDSPVRQLQYFLGKPGPLHGDLRCGVANLARIGIGQVHGGGADVFVEPLDLSRAWNRYDPGFLREQPGLTFSFEEYVAPQIASGALVRVLEDWCPPFAGYFLYYPSRRQQPAALSALIETLRL
jgi:hypothetical protein